MWKPVLLLVFGVQFFQACFGITQDESARSYLQRFNTTRNYHVSPALKTAARDYIMKTFNDFGLDTWTEEFSSNQKNFSGINIIGRVNGRYTGTSKDKILIIAAHYDTVETTQGVDDNGSGMTALFQALRFYKSSNNMNCTQDHTLLFVAFDLEEEQLTCQAAPCSCPRITCGSKHFVSNFTRYVDRTNADVQGAYILDTIMNYNTTNVSQELPSGFLNGFPSQHQWIKNNSFRGDFLVVIGRKQNDSVLSDTFVSNFKQGAFKVLQVPLPFNGKPQDQTQNLQNALNHFLRSDHVNFWNSLNSWPAVHLTDTAEFRGYMKSCYHHPCDNMDGVTPEMIAFLGKTVDAIVGAAQSLTKRVCPTRENCKNVLIEGGEATISSPYYPSQYPNDIECSWYRDTNKEQTLEFVQFDIEDSNNCTNDFLEVLAGNTAGQANRVIGRYCGSTLPGIIRVSDKVVKIRFVSDALASRKGFRINWSTTPKPTAATDLVTSKVGISGFIAILTVLSNVLFI